MAYKNESKIYKLNLIFHRIKDLNNILYQVLGILHGEDHRRLQLDDVVAGPVRLDQDVLLLQGGQDFLG